MMIQKVHNKPGCLNRPSPRSGSNYPPPNKSNLLFLQGNYIIFRLEPSIRCPGAAC